MDHNDTLKRLHGAQLEIMDEIHRICHKHGIRYFLDSGTALGAVRHKGFIPWDDDVDIGMLRDDYERFLDVAGKELKERFFLQHKATEPRYQKYNAKLRLRGTFFPEEGTEGYSQRGIFVDIYPFDYCGNTREEAIRSVRRERKMLRFLRFRQTGESRRGLKALLYRVCGLVPESSVEKRYLRFCRRYRTGKFLTCYSYRMLQSKDLVFPREVLEGCEETAFEDRKYDIMSAWDAYLRIMYGDYMVLPKESDRVCHLSGGIVFEDEKTV